jgi:hypothetical protein
MIRTVFIIILVFFTIPLSAQPTQTIRGTVIDYSSNQPIAFASVIVLNTIPSLGVTTDSAGNFVILDVPVGRYNIQASYVGYEPAIIREVTVNSAKEIFLTIRLKENVRLLNEVIIKPNVNKEQALNSMATVSARMLSVEEASRYAGGFDDPARLASSFAGVASNTEQNGIIVRGNAPKFLQWKMEGIEIPNPNHFGDLISFGGGTLTALSSQMLANSDFFTGAFPAEYNNALSGVFDITMRTGNNQKREHTFQVGLIGIDASSEGPFKKGGKASYLFNYRYSTLSLLAPLLPEDASGLKYQDLSFKLNFPTAKAGIFSVWGMGLMDRASAKAKTDSTEWVYYNHSEENNMGLHMGATGISHEYFFKKNAYIKSTLAATANGTNWSTKKLNHELSLQPHSEIRSNNYNFTFSSLLNKKFSLRHTNKTGVLINGMAYDILLKDSPVSNIPPQEIVNTNGFSTLVSAFSSSSINLTSGLLLNIGVNSQLFTLNNRYTVEPRLGLRQRIKENQSIGLAYGLHSRLERLNFYFNNSLSTYETAVNKNLDFTKAHHIVLSYDHTFKDVTHLRVEPYFQHLFSVPVIADNSFSLINLQGDWFFADKLQNTGKGRNYGLDVTIERYMSKGFYYLVTATVFKSEYKGGDDIWHSTRFNRNYVFNFLAGKEWQVGASKQNMFILNSRFTFQGGNRYSPVNEAASQEARAIVYDETSPFTMQAQPSLNVHFTASYKINRSKTSSEIALKILNLTGQPDSYGYKYNQLKNTIERDLVSVIVPNLSYKIQF